MLLTVFRTLFYQFLLLFVGLSVGFIANAEYIGWKSSIISRSVSNIFFPVVYDETQVRRIKDWGAFKLWGSLNMPEGFKVIEEAILAEEWYWCKFSFKDSNGETVTKIDSVRIRWKPWEYYYEMPNSMSVEELREYVANGDLNSQESDRAFALQEEYKELYKQGEKE